MASWDMGYNSDSLYTYNYFRELNPLYAKFIFTSQGLDFPEMQDGGYACELGFGQGISITIHAAASNTKWTGTDFNPTQVSFAKRLAKHGKVEFNIEDAAFGEFAQRDDMPQFDYICFHGIWSWISKENQGYLLEFIRKNLKLGGVVYVSYNVSPGFMAVEPMRHMMYEFEQTLPSSLDTEQRVTAVQQFLHNLAKIHPTTLSVQPAIANQINQMLNQDKHYLLSEYLNAHWDIIHFSDMAEQMEKIKLSFACTASAGELIPGSQTTAEHDELLKWYKGKPIFETVRDFLICRRFRRDFFVKGLSVLSKEERNERFDQLCVIFTSSANHVDYTLKNRQNENIFKKEEIEPIKQVLADYKVHSIDEIIASVQEQQSQAGETVLDADTIRNGVCLLMFNNNIAPAVKPEQVSAETIERCDLLNQRFMSSKYTTEFNFVVSPLLQGGLPISTLDGILLRYVFQNPNASQEQMVQDILPRLKKMGVNISRANKPVFGQEAKDELIVEYINNFIKESFKMFRGLMVLK